MRSLFAHAQIEIPLVVTQPDRPAGRGRRLSPPPVKRAALELGLPVYQPESLREQAHVESLRAVNPDLLVVVAYGEILRRHVLELAPHGAVNVHPSLLPRYRGSAPVRAAILNGDTTTGVSIIKLVRRLDAGPIIEQREVAIHAGENAHELEARLATVASEMLPAACLAWIEASIVPHQQDETLVTVTREWSRDDARIDWSGNVIEIERLVRASQPWPVAWTTLAGEPFRVLSASADRNAGLQLAMARRIGSHILVGCGVGALILDRVQPAGKRPMEALSWWNGVQKNDVIFEDATPRATDL